MNHEPGTHDGRFPDTRHSVVAALADPESGARELALASVAQAYWWPVYAYLRLRRRQDPEEARDFTQGFFTYLLEKPFLERFDPARSRFRSWIRLGLDAYVNRELESRGRLKRGGGVEHLSLDFDSAEARLPQIEDPGVRGEDEWFHHEWMRELVQSALDELARWSSENDRDEAHRIFARYDLQGPDAGESLRYCDVADELGVSESRVTNALHAQRQRLRAILLRRLRELCATEDEYREEARALLGDVP